ncbi:hypothetical protein ACFX14_040330 [Malus domestica]
MTLSRINQSPPPFPSCCSAPFSKAFLLFQRDSSIKQNHRQLCKLLFHLYPNSTTSSHARTATRHQSILAFSKTLYTEGFQRLKKLWVLEGLE